MYEYDFVSYISDMSQTILCQINDFKLDNLTHDLCLLHLKYFSSIALIINSFKVYQLKLAN